MQIVVAPFQRQEKIASTLLQHLAHNIAQDLEKIHYVNVDETDNKTHDLLTKAGFEIVAKQYEMALSLNKK
jgi:ribosomal protein S18 acetylase RimI-like enzyme